MTLGRKLSSLWKTLFQKARLDRELNEELRIYLDGLIEKKIRAGQDPAAARRAAMLEMGGLTQIKADVQRARVGARIDALWQDVRFTLRGLIRRPAFAVVAVLTFALGIGANTAIFSVVNAVLIQPLPYKDASQLVFVWCDLSSAGNARAPLGGAELKDLREWGTLFSSFGAFWPNTATLTGDRDPEQLRIGYVTSNFFAKRRRARSSAGLIALSVGVVILLATTCLNVAGLLIARAAARTKETALRLAIGAGQGQIFRQCLVQGLVLAIIGSAGGVLFGEICLRALVALRPPTLSRLEPASVDTVVLVFTTLTAVFWGILFSFAPMVEVIRTDIMGGLFGNTRRIGALRYRTRAALVTLQIAFGVVLLVGAGLMIRTFVSLQRLDPGYRSDQMLSARVNVSGHDGQMALNAFHRRLQAELGALPGVTGVGSVSHLPFDNLPNWGGPYYLKDGPDPDAPLADFRAVSPGYLETIGARLLEGRYFTEADDSRSQRVVIVDDLLAKRNWPSESAVGKRISLNPEFFGRTWMTVVGVVRHMRLRSLVEDLSDQIYLPIRQSPRPTSYVLRTDGDPVGLAGMVRDVVRRLDPQLPVYDVRLMEDYLFAARSTQRFTMLLAAVFAGVIAGVAGAAIVARYLESQLFGVTPFDIPTYMIAIAVIALAGMLASWFPARKASASNPLKVIQSQ